MQLTLDSAILQRLLSHAAAAAHVVGSLDDGVASSNLVTALADNVDAIVHELTELLGNPHLIAASGSFADPTCAPEFNVGAVGMPNTAIAPARRSTGGVR